MELVCQLLPSFISLARGSLRSLLLPFIPRVASCLSSGTSLASLVIHSGDPTGGENRRPDETNSERNQIRTFILPSWLLPL